MGLAASRLDRIAHRNPDLNKSKVTEMEYRFSCLFARGRAQSASVIAWCLAVASVPLTCCKLRRVQFGGAGRRPVWLTIMR